MSLAGRVDVWLGCTKKQTFYCGRRECRMLLRSVQSVALHRYTLGPLSFRQNTPVTWVLGGGKAIVSSHLFPSSFGRNQFHVISFQFTVPMNKLSTALPSRILTVAKPREESDRHLRVESRVLGLVVSTTSQETQKENHEAHH